MDDFITLLIYVAILVIGGIASAYRKKGSKTQQRPPEKRFPTFDPFEDFIKEIEEKEQEKEVVVDVPGSKEPEVPSAEPVSSPYTVLETIPREEAKSLEEIKNETFIPEISDYLKDKNDLTNTVRPEHEISKGEITDTIKDFKYDQEEEVTTVFDLKKAVIFSEILKRKDF